MSNVKRDEQTIGGDLFVKQFEADGSIIFYMNGRELSLSEWNREINLRQPMANLDSHPNPLIRYKEAHRRRKIISLLRLTGNEVVADIGSERGYLADQIAARCRNREQEHCDGNRYSPHHRLYPPQLLPSATRSSRMLSTATAPNSDTGIGVSRSILTCNRTSR